MRRKKAIALTTAALVLLATAKGEVAYLAAKQPRRQPWYKRLLHLR